MLIWLPLFGLSCLCLGVGRSWILQARFEMDQPGGWARLFGRVKRLFFGSLTAKGLYFGGVIYPHLIVRLRMPEMGVVFGTTGLLVLQLLEFFWLLRWLYPLERYACRLTLSPLEYAFFRAGLAMETLAPPVIALHGLMLFRFLWVNHFQPPPGSLGYLLGTAILILITALFFWRRRFLLPVRQRALPFTGMRAEVQRLGRELGVSVREVLVLDGTRFRVANAFAIGSDRIAISDYLLAHLTEREVLSVLAHEVMHLAQRRRLLRLWLLELGAGIALAPLLGRWRWEVHLVFLPLLLWLALMPMIRLRRRHERDADAFAAHQYGPEALHSALLKVAELNNLSLTANARHRVHPGFAERLAWLERCSPAGLGSDG